MLKEESDDDGANTEDDDSSEDDSLFCAMRVKPAHTSNPTTTANHFAALTSVENDGGDGCSYGDIANKPDPWKVVVHRKSMRSPQMSQRDRRMCERLANTNFENALVEVAGCTKPKLPTHGIEVKTEKELDQALRAHPHLMTAMPTNRKKMMKASKKAPGAHLLQEGEVWAMVDSGAGVPGINVNKHCPHLRHKLREATKKFKCVTANGGEMVVDKEIELNIELDGQPVTVKFSELPVQMPILSVRKIVKRGNRVVFQDQGGYIVNKSTGRNINFVDNNGVYFVRMKLPESPAQNVR